MMDFCTLTKKLASPCFPQQKAYEIFFIGFCIIAENKLCDKHKFVLLAHRVQQANSNTTFVLFKAQIVLLEVKS